MSDALLTFAIGPVQGFIAEARRPLDLYGGSTLLSELMRAAVTALENGGARLIYPSAASAPSIPNKCLVALPAERVEASAKAAEQAVQQRLRDYGGRAREILADIESVRPDGQWDEIFNRQLETHLEIFWAAVPLPGGSDYSHAYTELNRSFAACKRTRHFAPIWEDGRKDSLSGQRSALHTKGSDANEYWRTVATSRRFTGAALKPDGRERLDALGAIKRFAFSQPIPSTSSIAATDFIERAVAKPETWKLLQSYSDLLARSSLPFYRVQWHEAWPYDGDLLFLETLEPARLKESYGIAEAMLSGEQLEAARKTLKELHKAAGGPPNLYYAVLQMDGDSIGKRVNDCPSEEAHQELSRQFADFARCARAIIEKDRGVAVYTGGDDVLALLPMQRALPIGEELAGAFSQLVPGAHASAGIAIAHYLAPLDLVLRAAREAEHGAKEIKDKNAVCVTVLKRSGEPVSARSRWLGAAPEPEAEARKAWDCLYAALSADPPLVSPRFAHEYARLAPTLSALPSGAQTSLLERALKRHQREQLNDGQQAQVEELKRALIAWARWLDSINGPERADYEPQTPGGYLGYPPPGIVRENENQKPLGTQELSRWLLLAAFLTRGGGE